VLEEWSIGGMEYWRNGVLEEWSAGEMEKEHVSRRPELSCVPNNRALLHYSTTPVLHYSSAPVKIQYQLREETMEEFKPIIVAFCCIY